jgi:hypothetical protein
VRFFRAPLRRGAKSPQIIHLISPLLAPLRKKKIDESRVQKTNRNNKIRRIKQMKITAFSFLSFAAFCNNIRKLYDQLSLQPCILSHLIQIPGMPYLSIFDLWEF